MSLGLTEGFCGSSVAHREDIRAYLEGLTVEGMVIDWGSGSKPVMKYVNGDKAMFHTIDINPQVNPDTLADIQSNTFNTFLKADHAFCMEVLEHTTNPQMVLHNIHHNLREGGRLHLSVPFLYPEHGENDYLRFTRQGLRYYAEEAGFKNIWIWDITDGFLMEATA